MWYLSFSDWFISLSITLPRSLRAEPPHSEPQDSGGQIWQDERGLARGRRGRPHKLHRPTLALLPRPPRAWGVWPRTTTGGVAGREPLEGHRGRQWGFCPSLRQARGQGWGVQDNDPTGQRTMHHVVAPAPSHDSCLRAEMSCLRAGAPESPFCLQHPCVPISKTPMFHVPLPRAPSSPRALGGPRPIG